ncbi:ABC transporter permease subunit [Bacillus aquiflavi]|uniref:ABC transporter permease subunit n=1 Tax=Bacillus aquiflavi TaxID=2672567 RepID=A0A6B3W3U2_9BACI|nr:ABC transporter permease subunit [Bacillus aquiflavi]MBA4538267.1 ABC transporter permease subunit [Bacillus aquiflavi]NEY82586.1 ABC transporter permease subunit [Bacillus aquiflavi]
MRTFLKQYSITIFIGIAIIVAWALFTKYASWVNPVIFPDPLTVTESFKNKLGELVLGLVSSMALLLPAFFCALLIGVAMGMFFGLNNHFRQIFMPYFHALSPIPPTLFIPYAIALMPTFQSASTLLIFIGAFWPIFLGTIHGVLLIEQHYLDNAKTLRLKGGDFLFKVVLPASSPYILNGTSTALGMSFLILTIAEMFGASSGMGYFIQYYSDFSQYHYVLAGIIFNSIIIVSIMIGFEKLKKRLLFWTNLKTESN